MDLELDESMDAFKKPKTNKKVMQLKVKLTQKRKQAPKSNAKTKKKATVVKTASPEKTTRCSTCSTSSTPAHNAELFKEINNNASETFNFADVDPFGEDLIPMKKMKLGADGEDDGEYKEYFKHSNELIPCKTCGKKLVGLELRIHTPACLRANLEACRFASGCMDSLRCRLNSDSSPLKAPSSDMSGQFDEGQDVTYVCPTCNCDLSLLSSELRNTHVNRCFDYLESMKLVGVGRGRKTSKVATKTNGLQCVICGRTFKSHSGLKKHYVACQKKHNFTTMTALTLNSRDQDNEVGVEILEAIKRADEQHQRDVDSNTDVTNAARKKKTTTKLKSKKKQPDFEEGVVQLALAVSSGEDLEKPLGKKTKKKKDLVPVMLLQSPSTKQKVIQERLRSIINETQGEDDIPSTPTLPVSSLRNLMTGQSSSSVCDVITNRDNDGEASHHHNPPENLRENHTVSLRSSSEVNRVIHHETRRILQESFGEGSSYSRHEQDTSQIRQEEDTSPVRPAPIIHHDEPTHQNVSASYELRSGELQSPEVSSSNMKHPSVPENGESNVANHRFHNPTSEGRSYVAEENKAYTKVFLKRKKSKWTMTGSMPSKSDCFVKGLLSQFERTASPHRALSQPCDRPVLSESQRNSKQADSLMDDGDNINCTLQNLELLEDEDTSLSSDSVQSHPSLENTSTNGSNVDADVQMLFGEDEQGSIYRRENLENPKLSLCEAFLSELCSDAHIILESVGKVLPLHKIILLCRCPKLLEEISRSHEFNLRMKDVSEEEIIPIIRYIYTSEFGTLPKNKEKLVKISLLMQRFGLPVPDSILQIDSHGSIPRKDTLHIEPAVEAVLHTVKSTVPALEFNKSRKLVALPCQPKPENDDSSHDDFHYFLSQPSPTQKSLSRNSSEHAGTSNDQRGSEQGYHSDNDMFDFSQFLSISDNDQSLQRLDDTHVEHGMDVSDKDIHLPNLSLSQFGEDPVLDTTGSDENHIGLMLISSDCVLIQEPGSDDSENQGSYLYYSSLEDSIFTNFENTDDARECLSLGDAQTGKKATKPRKNTSQPKERTRRKRSSSVGEGSKTARKLGKLLKSSSETEKLYVSERLPRFKQREHIKNRPGVANMGKNVSSRSLRGTKKEGSTGTARTKSASKEISKDPVPARPPESVTLEVKSYKFKKTSMTRKLADYAVPSPSSDRAKSQQSETEKEQTESVDLSDISSNSSEYDNLFSSNFDQVFKTPLLKDPATIALERADTSAFDDFKPPRCDEKDTETPVPMTPMPDFSDMETPEVFRQGQKIGLKKRIGKTKIKKKLKEVFMYNHQAALSDEEELTDSDDEDVRSSQQKYKITEDDLKEDIGEIKKWKLELSRLSASPRVLRYSLSFPKMYSFERLSTEEVQRLSSAVVQQMHLDKTLLQALLEAQGATGSIKRGSRQDQKRCWDIVTPGSEGYDPKLNAILRLSEEYQSAITTPLISCVVDNYIEYKRYMFECLPVLCDRMESEMLQ